MATDEEAAATRYAAPQPPVPVDNVFCQTCLKNQHLFTKSLAQYFPDDPTDPEYERLELHYFRYRKGLEKRYPQVCDDCAARVEQRIQQAGYTAKTDHLRRMMDLSRRNHSRARRKTALDRISSLGKAVWIAGFFLQMLWHLVIILRATPGPDADPLRRLSRRSLAALLDGLRKMASVLPRDEKLIRWSLEAAVLSAWWNPHFVQFKRGFARHLVGLGQWYAFQALTIFSRFLFASILVGNGRSVQAQLSAQLAMAVSTVLVRDPPPRPNSILDSFGPPRYMYARQNTDHDRRYMPMPGTQSASIPRRFSRPRSSPVHPKWDMFMTRKRGRISRHLQSCLMKRSIQLYRRGRQNRRRSPPQDFLKPSGRPLGSRDVGPVLGQAPETVICRQQ